MDKVVILTLGGGSLERGFSAVSAQVSSLGLGRDNYLKCSGSLPAADRLSHCHQQWRQLYLALQYSLGWPSRIQMDDQPIVTNVSREAFEQLSDRLATTLNDWLSSDTFRKIDQQIRLHLTPEDDIRVVIETDCPCTRQLPWHLWHFLDDYPQAEVAIANLNYCAKSRRRTPSGAVRILAILGNATGIDIQSDRDCLTDLPGADPIFLVEPSRLELDRWLWDEQGWDILFFAGHSASLADGSSGAIGINPTESLTIEQLRHALRAAIAHGLQLAIFNSCDGLGVARAMADLDIPQLVVMREPVPDPVAQSFLTGFLQAFAGGRSFYRSVRQAREKLQGLEDTYLCASWLPAICQNPAAQPPTWPSLQGLETEPPVPSLSREPSSSSPPSPVFSAPSTHTQKKTTQLFWLILTRSLFMAIVVMVLRGLGILEPIELKAFDYLLRQRPIETMDPRLLVVEITDADTSRYGYPLSDRILAKALDNLYQFKPRAVGVDLHRAVPRGDGRSELLRQFAQHPSLSTVCFGDAADRTKTAPAELSEWQQQTQTGLSDLIPDPGPRAMIRRQLLAVDPNLGERSFCLTPYSLSLRLVEDYLKVQDIPVRLDQQSWSLGNAVVPALAPRFGGYQRLDGLSNETLINYRSLPANSFPGQRVTLREVLDNDLQANWVRDRVILIGTTATVGQDLAATPLGTIPGVWVHGHQVSQLLSAALDQRPLIQVMPQLGRDWGSLQWGDGLWVLAWTLWGSWMAWRLPWQLSLVAGGIGAIGLYQFCLLALAQGFWLAWIPACIGMGLGMGAIYIWTVSNLQNNSRL